MQKLMLTQPIAVGVALGGVIGLASYASFGWYRTFINWQFSHWQFFLPMLAAGIFVALISERD